MGRSKSTPSQLPAAVPQQRQLVDQPQQEKEDYYISDHIEEESFVDLSDDEDNNSKLRSNGTINSSKNNNDDYSNSKYLQLLKDSIDKKLLVFEEEDGGGLFVCSINNDDVLWIEYLKFCNNNNNNNNNNSAAAKCAHIYLSSRALDICCPKEVGTALFLARRSFVPKAARDACLIRQVLAYLFLKYRTCQDEEEKEYIELISFCSEQQHAGSKEPITAQQMYSIVDNYHIKQIQDKETEKLEYIERKGGDEPNISSIKPNHRVTGLKPTLRNYQKYALDWMLDREGVVSNGISKEPSAWKICWLVVSRSSIFPLYKYSSAVVGDDDNYSTLREIFFNPFTGWITKSMEEAKAYTIGEGSHILNGGILAESMGLGKTVEALACILSHSRSSFYTHRPQYANIINTITCTSQSSKSVNDDAFCAVCTTPLYRSKQRSKVHPCKCCHKLMHSSCCSSVPYFNLNEKENQEEKQSEYKILCPNCIYTELSQKTLIPLVSQNASQGQCSGESNDNQISEKQIHLIETNLIPSRATLIIAPPAILDQWIHEINKHVQSKLKIIVYPGIREILNGSSYDRQMSNPYFLADADIIITTFSALNGDLCHSVNPYMGQNAKSNSGSARSFRKRKKYAVIPSPLIMISFFRICLDEAQNVETPTAQSAKMANLLDSKYKWCMSGTPIGKKGTLDDLWGLLLFLKLKPFGGSDHRGAMEIDEKLGKKSFESVILSKAPKWDERLLFLLEDIFWRSTKSNESVRLAMGIPEQVEMKVNLKFSSIEKHFYERTLEATANAASLVSSIHEEHNLTPTKKKIRKKQTKSEAALSLRLHQLRAACCHPQVGTHGIKVKGKKRKGLAGMSGSSTANVGADPTHSIANHVLSMDEVLEKLIDDAQNKAEEAQRILTLHSNALASLSKLRYEANLGNRKSGGSIITASPTDDLKKSFRLYCDALAVAKANAEPTPLSSKFTVQGSRGFECIKEDKSREVYQGGKATLQWTIDTENIISTRRFGDEDQSIDNYSENWAKFDFGPQKQICALKLRLSNDAKRISSTTCIIQASNSSFGGAFADVKEIQLDNADTDGYIFCSGFNLFRSKSWRLFFKTSMTIPPNIVESTFRIEVQLFEPNIRMDPLQTIHILNNATIVGSKLISDKLITDIEKASGFCCKEKIDSLESELKHLENIYLGSAKANHNNVNISTKNAQNKRIEQQKKLDKDECWWEDTLSYLTLSRNKELEDSLLRAIGDSLASFSVPPTEFHYMALPRVRSCAGLHQSLSNRADMFKAVLGREKQVLEKIIDLSTNPSYGEVMENSHCSVCRKDWDQTGPKCRHCILEEDLKDYEKDLSDPIMLHVLKEILKWAKDVSKTYKDSEVCFFLEGCVVKGEDYFKLHELAKNELSACKRKWRAHFDLLSDIDELASSKMSMRLLQPHEETRFLTQSEMNYIVLPSDIQGLWIEHDTKSAMAIAQLKRSKASLGYLRNLSEERRADREDNTCAICLSEYGKLDRAVLKCGHSFHESCLKSITRGSSILCPMRCSKRTDTNEVLIASDISKDDGTSRNRSDIKGSWGTKIDRLVGDILEVTERGEKLIVFSMWEDMLDIAEMALTMNKITLTRPNSKKNFGKCLEAFRSSECTAILLNVKQGGEGLTLVEATHIFMIEPLLDAGLDLQAINRIHRIGQTKKTYIHRYIISGTVEEKIDEIRMRKQQHDSESLEAMLVSGKYSKRTSSKVNAGGLDGCLDDSEIQEILEID